MNVKLFLSPFFVLAFSFFSYSKFSSVNTNHLFVNSLRPSSLLIDGPQNVCKNVSAFYSISPVTNATSYDWILPNGWIGSSLDNSITVAINDISGVILLTVNRSSGGALSYSVDVTVSTVNASFIQTPEELSTLSTDCFFTNNSTEATEYLWDFGDGKASNIENPIHAFSFDESGSFTVTLVAYSSIGCVDTVQKTIKVKEDLIFYVPNAFTPDGDSYNESFRPVFTSGYDPYNYHLVITDRERTVIFESRDASIGWSGNYGVGGKIVVDGIYNWKIDYKIEETNEWKTSFGHLCLLK